MFEYLIIVTHVTGGQPESEPCTLVSWNSVISTMPHLSSQQNLEKLCPQ